jgi:hypothetical protein
MGAPKPPAAQRPHIREIDADSGEASPLLAGESSRSSGSSESDIPRLSTQGTWNGLDDFEGLPWWRVPSVSELMLNYL